VIGLGGFSATGYDLAEAVDPGMLVTTIL